MVQAPGLYSVSELVYIIDGYGTKCYYQLTFTHILHIFSIHLHLSQLQTAPTDAAFANLPEGALDALVAEDPPNTLKGVLLYHVAQPNLESKDLSNGQVIETLKDDPNTVTVSIDDDGIFINQAEVTGPDNLANNGVAHIIGAVLIPPDFEVPVAIDEAV